MKSCRIVAPAGLTAALAVGLVADWCSALRRTSIDRDSRVLERDRLSVGVVGGRRGLPLRAFADGGPHNVLPDL